MFDQTQKCISTQFNPSGGGWILRINRDKIVNEELISFKELSEAESLPATTRISESPTKTDLCHCLAFVILGPAAHESPTGS